MTALRHWLVFLLIWLSGSLLAGAEEAKPLRGVALIIGQSNYTHVSPLPNASQDARAIGKLMTDLGFETRNAADRNARTLKREIDRFIEDAEGADVAFIYYAGHGIEAGGENWLVPVDADLASLDDARANLMPASEMVERLKQVAPVVIFLLDACRNSPFPPDALLKPDAQSVATPIVQTGLVPSRGMTPVEEDQPAPIENVGVVMGFAAEPGKAALDGPKDGNSPYAAALLRHLSASNGAAFGDVMTMVSEEVYLATETRQRPWINASMRRLLYFGVAPSEGDKDEALITGERRQLLLTIAALPTSGRQQVEAIAKSDKVPLDSLYGMLRAIGAETPKDPGALDALLRAQAEKLKSVLAENAALKSSDPEIIRLSSLADRAVAQGAMKAAIGFREQAKAKAASLSATLDQTEAALKMRRLELAEVYSKSGETYMLAFDFGKAAGDFQQAFVQVEHWDDTAAWKYKLREGEAWASRGFYKGDRAALDQARAAYEGARHLVAADSKPQEWLNTETGLALALRILGERESGTETLKKSISIMEAALSRRAGIKTPLDWSNLENNLALALWRLGEREPGTVSLERSGAAFETALADVPKESAPISRALIENNLGVVLTAIGQRESTAAAFDRSIGVFEAALARFAREDARLSWAVIQNNLATALSYKGQREIGTETLERSAVAYRSALEELNRETAPLAWATATNNLGMVLLRMGERQQVNDNLIAAEKSFAASLEELTPERTPLDWAEVQTNRASALLALGKRETGTAKLLEAAAVYEAAMVVRKRDVVPLAWANGQMNLGLVYFALGEREAGTQSYKRAGSYFAAALSEFTFERVPLDWAATVINLGVTYTRIGLQEADAGSLDQAVEVLRHALATDFRAQVPSYWADMQYHLGNALLEKARRDTQTSSLNEAAMAFLEAQKEVTRDHSPFYWAAIENNLASIHFFLGQRTKSKAEFELARSATLAAWDVYKKAGNTSLDGDFEWRIDEIDDAVEKLP